MAGNPLQIVTSAFARKRSRMIVEIDLDPVPGWGHQPEDHVRAVQQMLDSSIGHYKPTVELIEGMQETDLLKSIMRQMLDKIENDLTVYAVVTTTNNGVDDASVYWHEHEAESLASKMCETNGEGFAWVHPLKVHATGPLGL